MPIGQRPACISFQEPVRFIQQPIGERPVAVELVTNVHDRRVAQAADVMSLMVRS